MTPEKGKVRKKMKKKIQAKVRKKKKSEIEGQKRQCRVQVKQREAVMRN